MPRRSPLSPSKDAFFPPNDHATHRDLLLFEERLKTNALLLNRRKSRYQLFLFQLIGTIVFLLSEVLLQTSFLSILSRFLLRHTLPEHYGPDDDFRVHPYFVSGLLFVAVTTLVLFFASGMYSEKIGYANRYVPHANRALRNFNMYLNMRAAPRASMLSPLSFLLARPAPSSPTTPSSPRTPSPTRLGKRSSSAIPIPSIPPSNNPRGELIFSSKVDRSFRESYERYRSAFERKREERERAAAASTWQGYLPWNWLGDVYAACAYRYRGSASSSSTPISTPGTATPTTSQRGLSPARPGSTRGRGGRITPTGGSSRRSSPVPRSERVERDNDTST